LKSQVWFHILIYEVISSAIFFTV